MRILLVGAEFFHAEGQTETGVANLIVAYHNFTKAPNNIC